MNLTYQERLLIELIHLHGGKIPTKTVESSSSGGGGGGDSSAANQVAANTKLTAIQTAVQFQARPLTNTDTDGAFTTNQNFGLVGEQIYITSGYIDTQGFILIFDGAEFIQAIDAEFNWFYAWPAGYKVVTGLTIQVSSDPNVFTAHATGSKVSILHKTSIL